MQIDQEYLRQILNSFIDSPRSFIWIADIMEHGIEIDDKFLFHMQILEDQRFIECLDKKSDLGYEILLGGEFRWSSRPEIWDVLKAEFADASLSTLRSAAKTLLLAFAKKQLGKYLEL